MERDCATVASEAAKGSAAPLLVVLLVVEGGCWDCRYRPQRRIPRPQGQGKSSRQIHRLHERRCRPLRRSMPRDLRSRQPADSSLQRWPRHLPHTPRQDSRQASRNPTRRQTARQRQPCCPMMCNWPSFQPLSCALSCYSCSSPRQPSLLMKLTA